MTCAVLKMTQDRSLKHLLGTVHGIPDNHPIAKALAYNGYTDVSDFASLPLRSLSAWEYQPTVDAKHQHYTDAITMKLVDS